MTLIVRTLKRGALAKREIICDWKGMASSLESPQSKQMSSASRRGITISPLNLFYPVRIINIKG